MPSLERNVYTTQPLERVWQFIEDFTTTERWNPAALSTDRIEGDGTVGSTYRQVTRLFTHEQKILYTVRDREPPHRLALTGSAGKVQFVDTFELQDLGNEVRVRYTISYTVAGVAVVLLPLLGHRLNRNTQQSADRMQQILTELH